MYCFFVSDLHGNIKKYQKLFQAILLEKPTGVFFGGDLLPNLKLVDGIEKFFDYLLKNFQRIKEKTETQIFLIMGNDDPRTFEKVFLKWDEKKIIHYVHFRNVAFKNLFVTGYSYIPPTPFMLKDWEKYDVSRYLSPGCIAPKDGLRTINVPENESNTITINEDLEIISKFSKPEHTIFLFHSPPHDTALDRLANDGKQIDHVPLDLHVGSVAIRQFISNKIPFATLHGHIHESVNITGKWHQKIKNTHLFSAAHDGTELALVKFHTDNLVNASREII